jgi:DNA-binding transcriptional LysR family regulator
MELRELRAFAIAAQELHFARAAELLHMSPSWMSELIRRLELELGAPLFVRTTRSITLTDAGLELLGRAEVILGLVEQTAEAIQAIAGGQAGTLVMGITPPAAPVIAPHLAAQFAVACPGARVEISRMWLPALSASLLSGAVDVALTCGGLGADEESVTSAEVGSEQLLAGLRPGHALAEADEIEIEKLGDMVLGLHPAHLFPAWHAAAQQILIDARLDPPIVELADTDLSTRMWSSQDEIEWVMLIGSLLAGHRSTLTRPVAGYSIPFTLSWLERSSLRPVVRRFVESSLLAELPAGWLLPARGQSTDAESKTP